jgi:hypothetical protein
VASYTYDGAPAARTRPQLWNVGVGALGGYLAACGLLALAAVPLFRAGVLRRPDGLLASAFAGGGAWATLSHLVAVAAATGAAAAVIAPLVGSRVERRVSILRVWGILLVTGIPAISVRGLLPLGPAVGFLAVAVLVHAYAIDGPPTRLERGFARAPRPARIGLLAAACMAVLAAAAYGPTHPFAQGSSTMAQTPVNEPDGDTPALFSPARGGAFGFEVESAGPIHPTVTGARVPGLTFPPSRVTVRSDADGTWVTIAFRPVDGTCIGPNRVISRVVLTYRVLGRTFSQPVILHHAPPAVRCSS